MRRITAQWHQICEASSSGTGPISDGKGFEAAKALLSGGLATIGREVENQPMGGCFSFARTEPCQWQQGGLHVMIGTEVHPRMGLCQARLFSEPLQAGLKWKVPRP